MSITYNSIYHNLPINTNINKQQGCETVILDRLHSQLEYMTNNHSKVLQVRCDLRYPQDTQIEHKRTHFSKFNKNLKRNLERNNKLPKDGKSRSEKVPLKDHPKHNIDPHITLVIEQHTPEHYPHAHVLVHVNGNIKQSANDILQRAERIWNSTLNIPEKNGLVDHCNKKGTNSFMIDRNSDNYSDTINNAFYQASYLAKTRGKENTPKSVWTVLGTRLPKI
jgi:hypothetical protein